MSLPPRFKKLKKLHRSDHASRVFYFSDILEALEIATDALTHLSWNTDGGPLVTHLRIKLARDALEQIEKLGEKE